MNWFSLMFSVLLCLAVRGSQFYPRVGVRDAVKLLNRKTREGRLVIKFEGRQE